MNRRVQTVGFAGAVITGSLGCVLSQTPQRNSRRQRGTPSVKGAGGQLQATPRGTLVGASSKFQTPTQGAQQRFRLTIDTAVRCISKQHPRRDKRVPYDCGEDAFFMAMPNAKTSSIGVADGVGSWSQLGIDPALFAWEVMKGCEAVACATSDASSDSQARADPKSVLSEAYSTSLKRGQMPYGSSTACVASLDHVSGDLRIANLGDSGVLILRDGDIVFKSKEQQHSFNCPFQLQRSPFGEAGDPPEAADEYRIKVKEGDLVVMATDGFLDNVHEEDIAELTSIMSELNTAPGDMAATLAKYARRNSLDDEYHSPFAVSAARHGYWLQGGKPDDITVVVSQVLENVDNSGIGN